MRCSFIVSTGRTGTQSLAKVLNQVSGDTISAYHEPSPSRIFRIISTLRASGLLSDRWSLFFIRFFRGGLIQRQEREIYVESNNFMFGLCDLLVNQFEGVRILHIVRDPKTYAESHLRHGVFRGFKGLVSRFFPYWLIKPRHLGIKTERLWLKMSQHVRLFWFWTLVNRVIGNDCRDLGERYRVVRFEDLFSDQELFLDTLIWLGMSNDKVGAASELISERYNIGAQPYKGATANEDEMLVDICGDLLEQYGYQR